MRRFLTACLLFGAACDRDHDHPPAAAEPGEKTLQVSVWNGGYEAFLEHPPLVAGTPAAFVTHLTELATFQPRREGALTFVMGREGRAAIEVPVAAPKRPGIYVPELTFPEAGSWTLQLRTSDGAVIGLPAFAVHASAAEARAAGGPEAAEGITFLKEQQWKLRLKTGPVGRRRLVERLRLPALVAAPPGGRAVVAAPLSGRLVAAGAPPPAIGTAVESGQILALLQPPVSELAARLVEAEAEVLRTRLAAEQAELVAERTRKLAAAQARSARELEEAEYAVKAARAAQAAAVELRTAYGTSGLTSTPGQAPSLALRAPIAGIVTRIEASLGEHVAADRAVFTIVDAREVLVEARIPEAELRRLGASREAFLELPGMNGDLLPVLGEGGGRVLLLAPEVDRTTRTVSLIYALPNPGGRLRLGMSLTLHLETARTLDGLAIPESAVVEEDGRPVAFVQVGGETFERRDLRLGLKDAGRLQVLEGLAEGERVVTDGAYAVRLAGASASLPAHGHEH